MTTFNATGAFFKSFYGPDPEESIYYSYHHTIVWTCLYRSEPLLPILYQGIITWYHFINLAESKINRHGVWQYSVKSPTNMVYNLQVSYSKMYAYITLFLMRDGDISVVTRPSSPGRAWKTKPGLPWQVWRYICVAPETIPYLSYRFRYKNRSGQGLICTGLG